MKKLERIKIKVTRADLRNRKIILVLEPDLLSNEVFAVNPFYDEGEDKNKLQKVGVLILLTEKNGKITVNAAEYNGTHYTTGHTQIHGINSMYMDKKDCAVAEILNTDYKYIEEEGRMNKLLSNWDTDIEFKTELIRLIDERKEQHAKDELKEAIAKYETAREDLERAMNLSIPTKKRNG